MMASAIPTHASVTASMGREFKLTQFRKSYRLFKIFSGIFILLTLSEGEIFSASFDT
jgi:hypothetical protein